MVSKYIYLAIFERQGYSVDNGHCIEVKGGFVCTVRSTVCPWHEKRLFALGEAAAQRSIVAWRVSFSIVFPQLRSQARHLQRANKVL